MSFLQKVRDSIYNPSFYARLRKQNLSSALVYFLLLALLFSLVRTVYHLPNLIDIRRQAPALVNKVVEYIPAELEIKIQDGQASTNVAEPYFIPLDPDQEATSSGQNLLVIDTKTPFSSTQMEEYNAVAWLTKDTLFYQDGEGEDLRAYQLTEVENLTVNRDLVRQLISYLNPWYDLITPILFVALLLGLFVASIFNLLYMFIFAALVWLMSQIFKWSLDYSQSYKIGLHAITLSLIIDLIIDITNRWTYQYTLALPHIPFVFTAITLAVVYLNLSADGADHPVTKAKTKNASSA